MCGASADVDAHVRRLAFKKTFIEPITEGRKTSTLRLTTALEPGDVVALTCQWGTAALRVRPREEVDAVGLAWKLTDDIARAEGFSDAIELVAVLGSLYPGHSEFFQIAFELAPVAVAS